MIPRDHLLVSQSGLETTGTQRAFHRTWLADVHLFTSPSRERLALCEAVADHGVEVGGVKVGRCRGHLHCECAAIRVPGIRRWDRAGRTKTDRSAWEGLNPELGKRRATTLTLLDGLPASKSDKPQTCLITRYIPFLHRIVQFRKVSDPLPFYVGSW